MSLPVDRYPSLHVAIKNGYKSKLLEKRITYMLLFQLTRQILWFTRQVFEGLHSQGQQTEVRDWVLLSLGSFIQRFVLFIVVITEVSIESHIHVYRRTQKSASLPSLKLVRGQ